MCSRRQVRLFSGLTHCRNNERSTLPLVIGKMVPIAHVQTVRRTRTRISYIIYLICGRLKESKPSVRHITRCSLNSVSRLYEKLDANVMSLFARVIGRRDPGPVAALESFFPKLVLTQELCQQ